MKQSSIAIIVLSIVLVASVAVNFYFISVTPAPVKQPAGTVSVIFGTPFYVDQIGNARARDVMLNGTALVTGTMIARSPVNFIISNYGIGCCNSTGATYVPESAFVAFEALNSTSASVRILLPKGSWWFSFGDTGINSTITEANFLLNYSYFG